MMPDRHAPSQAGSVIRWMAWLFVVGSACFALGAAPSYAVEVGTEADAITFFVGSVFFTSAATLQWISWHADRDRRRLDGWAAAVQWVGTIFFNLSTFFAMNDQLTATQADADVWTPDARGSVCFLVASGLAWYSTTHRVWAWRPHSRAWLMAALNMLGSIAFGASAIASYVVPDTDEVRDAAMMNLGTFVGALCFLLGALLLLPKRSPAVAPA